MSVDTGDALGLATVIRTRRLKAPEVVEAVLAQIATLNPVLNCFRDVLGERARRSRACRGDGGGRR